MGWIYAEIMRVHDLWLGTKSWTLYVGVMDAF